MLLSPFAALEQFQQSLLTVRVSEAMLYNLAPTKGLCRDLGRVVHCFVFLCLFIYLLAYLFRGEYATVHIWWSQDNLGD